MLTTVDLTRSLDTETYKRLLIHYQVALACWPTRFYVQQRPVAIVFEGWDAAGKGGAIRRVTEAIDPRGFVVYPIAKPQGDDATHHYLWRFWRRLPEKGQIAIFDRSWYGRVMVERIEGFCTEAEWKRAYREINYFERQLVDFGTVLFKFWLHISKEEQLARFESRSGDKLREWKLTDEDWRNRGEVGSLRRSRQRNVAQNQYNLCPWTIVEGDSKLYARIKITKTLVDKLSQELDYDPFQPTAAAVEAEKRKKKKKK